MIKKISEFYNNKAEIPNIIDIEKEMQQKETEK